MAFRLTDGGLETSLIFLQGIDLPCFAAFPLLDDASGRRSLEEYWEPYLALAREERLAFAVDTPTWRANPDWGGRLGYDAAALDRVNRDAAEFAHTLAGSLSDAVVNGVVGPRGDGYVVGDEMSAAEAADYHQPQVRALAAAGVDQVTAVTMTYPDEAIGVVRSAAAAGVTCVISFTVEVDGRLPDGTGLREAVEVVDAETGGAPRGFMVNCAHPTHFAPALVEGPWLERILGIRANASTMSHAELDAAEELDDGDPDDLALRYRDVSSRLPGLELFGGCCGTDHRHIRAIAAALASRS